MRLELAALIGGLGAVSLLSLTPGELAPPVGHVAVHVLGHDSLTATVMWAGLGAQLISDSPPDDGSVVDVVRQVGRLDASWRAPWAYTGLVLAQAHSPLARTVFLEASLRFPHQAWFPGQLALLHKQGGDRVEAARWMRTAAERPDAPTWCIALAREWSRR